MKRNKKLWHKRLHCKNCKGFKTWGGIKLFGFIKIRKWKHTCRCFKKLAKAIKDVGITSANSGISINKEQDNDNKTTD